MAVPRKKTSKSKKGSRRANHFLSEKSSATCSNCGAKHAPHRICQSCGYYKGKKVVEVKQAA